MYINNIIIKMKQLPNGNYWFEASSNGKKVSFGSVQTFNFNMLTKTFSATGMKLTGIKEVIFEEESSSF